MMQFATGQTHENASCIFIRKKGKEEEYVHSSTIVWLFGLIRSQDDEVLPALYTRPFPGLFIIGLWHIVYNWVLFETTGAGETDDIPGPRPYYRRFNNTLHHDFNICDAGSLRDCRIAWFIFSYSHAYGMRRAYIWWRDFHASYPIKRRFLVSSPVPGSMSIGCMRVNRRSIYESEHEPAAIRSDRAKKRENYNRGRLWFGRHSWQ